jgi:hypothetical protein
MNVTGEIYQVQYMKFYTKYHLSTDAKKTLCGRELGLSGNEIFSIPDDQDPIKSCGCKVCKIVYMKNKATI